MSGAGQQRRPASPALTRVREWLAAAPAPSLEDRLRARELPDEEIHRLRTPYDDRVPLPPDAEERLRADHPRLQELRRAYAATGLPPASSHSRWIPGNVNGYVDLRWFRGDTMIQWHYRELPRATRLKLFILLDYVSARDPGGLIAELGEDGMFGCWTYEYPGRPRVSRDLLESVNELLFLDRELGLLSRQGARVLDIGAGYGRLAHRMAVAAPVAEILCLDAIPESTFLCEYYLEFRGCAPPARAVPFHELTTAVSPGGYDLAVNVHSFSECTAETVEWWVAQLRHWRVPTLFIVPNEPVGLTSLEADGTHRDLMPVLAGAGYRLTREEPVIDDPDVRAMIRLNDRFLLFEHAG